MDIDFPSDAEILFSIKHDRNNEVYYNYIIHTQQPVEFPSITPRKIKPNSSIEVLKKAGTIGPLGKLISEYTHIYDGKYNDEEWRAYQTNFESGSYLDIKIVR